MHKIFTKDNKVLELFVTNISPHNVIGFDDVDFMNYVKNILWDEYNIASIKLEKKDINDTIWNGYCNLGEYENTEELKGLLYIMSVAVINPDNYIDDYYERFYSKKIEVELKYNEKM